MHPGGILKGRKLGSFWNSVNSRFLFDKDRSNFYQTCQNEEQKEACRKNSSKKGTKGFVLYLYQLVPSHYTIYTYIQGVLWSDGGHPRMSIRSMGLLHCHFQPGCFTAISNLVASLPFPPAPQKPNPNSTPIPIINERQDRRFEGTIVKYLLDKGFGFIRCIELKQRFPDRAPRWKNGGNRVNTHKHIQEHGIQI